MAVAAVFGALVYNMVQRVKIDGPLYAEIIQQKDLVADILPPPEYVIEAYLMAVELGSPSRATERERLVTRIAELEAQYEERQRYWDAQLAAGPLRELLLTTSSRPARRLFELVHTQLVPLVRSGDYVSARRVIDAGLHDAYHEHRLAIDSLVGKARARVVEAEVNAARELSSAYIPLVVGTGIVLMGLALALLVTTLDKARGDALALAEGMTAELSAAKTAAEAASRAKSEFLANMSHEIRTPLTVMLGFADFLGDESAYPPNGPPRAEVLATIKGAGEHLLTILNDILDLSKIEADRVHVEQVETRVHDLARDVRRLFAPHAAAKGVVVEVVVADGVPSRISSDPTRLRQILMNLMGNAIKFTNAGSVRLGLATAGEPGAPTLVFDVEDTGVGITAEQAHLLFTPFGQADTSVTRKFGGTGLGLTISRRLAHLMGGSLTLFRTGPGEGSCFRVELPLHEVTEPPPALSSEEARTTDDVAPPKSAARRLRGRILLAEDGLDNQRLIRFHLTRGGASVDVADNGQIALALLDRADAAGAPYDLVVTDMQMPEMDGYTLARTLRARGDTRPVIALTAHAMSEDEAKCFEAGCDAYATKPIDKTVLIDLCSRWLSASAEAPALVIPPT